MKRGDNMDIKLSVIVPCYNEGRMIRKNIHIINKYLKTLNLRDYEIIVVNDGSKDNTLEELKSLSMDLENCHFLDNGRNRGKGYTVKHGMLSATGDIICFTDADLSTPIQEIKRALEYVLPISNKIVIGSRSINGSNVEIKQPFYRVFMGKVFSFLANSIVPMGRVIDTQCGFKCFTKQAVQDIFPNQQMDGFSFDVEILHLAKIHNYEIYEMPVTWINDEDSKVDPIKDSISMFRDLWIIRRTHKGLRRRKG